MTRANIVFVLSSGESSTENQ